VRWSASRSSSGQASRTAVRRVWSSASTVGIRQQQIGDVPGGRRSDWRTPQPHRNRNLWSAPPRTPRRGALRLCVSATWPYRVRRMTVLNRRRCAGWWTRLRRLNGTSSQAGGGWTKRCGSVGVPARPARLRVGLVGLGPSLRARSVRFVRRLGEMGLGSTGDARQRRGASPSVHAGRLRTNDQPRIRRSYQYASTHRMVVQPRSSHWTEPSLEQSVVLDHTGTASSEQGKRPISALPVPDD
jgi:hypothetical protein